MKKLSLKETLFVASMLFGMFFGAGNLIFPASMGQLSGSHMWTASIGFLITGWDCPFWEWPPSASAGRKAFWNYPEVWEEDTGCFLRWPFT